MTDEQINAAIAEACGLKKPCRKVKLNDKGFFITQHAKLPNYCHDLNAMHEAEKGLEAKTSMMFGGWLLALCKGKNATWHATAHQRAEAFLRTLGKWNHSGDATEMVEEAQK